jgi:hypothetical protein
MIAGDRAPDAPLFPIFITDGDVRGPTQPDVIPTTLYSTFDLSKHSVLIFIPRQISPEIQSHISEISQILSAYPNIVQKLTIFSSLPSLSELSMLLSSMGRLFLDKDGHQTRLSLLFSHGETREKT